MKTKAAITRAAYPTTDRAPHYAQSLSKPAGFWGWWLGLTTDLRMPNVTARDRDRQRRGRLLSALQLAAIVLLAALLPRGVFPVFDPGTLFGILGFAVIVIITMVLNRLGRVSAAAALFVGGLFVIIAASQLFTPTGHIDFEDLAGYDFLVIPIVIAGALLPRRATIFLLVCCITFIILDLGFATHGASLDAYLPHASSPFLSIYPVAIYPVILLTVVAVIAALSASSVARAMEEADRTQELEEAYQLLAEQERVMEVAINGIQQIHARIANGDLQARAAIAQDNPLLPLALSMNLMLERLTRAAASSGDLNDLDQQVAHLSRQVSLVGQGNLRQPISGALGRLSPIAAATEQWRVNLLGMLQHSRTLLERMYDENAKISATLAQIDPTANTPDDAVAQMRAASETINRLITTLREFVNR